MSESITTDDLKTDLDGWLQRLGQKEMPILGDTVRTLCQKVSDASVSARDLAGIILRDPAMTSSVLKIANSPYYNTGRHEISTISRAVVLLGFDVVRSIGLSVSIIDTFLQGDARDRVIELMRQSVFAAVQAKAIAVQAGDPAPEEVFVAALLYRIGHIAFWSFASDREAAALETGLTDTSDSAKAIAEMEKRVLGVSLPELTRGLAREWRLGELLNEALDPAGTNGKGRDACVLLGHELEEAARRHGWDSPAVNQIVRRIAANARVSPQAASQTVTDALQDLKQVASAFGIPASATLQPKPSLEVDKSGDQTNEIRRPAPMLQLKILRELSSVLRSRPDIQVILDMIIEGIYRGIAMDRTLVAVFAPDRRSLRVKYVLGDRQDRLAGAFRLQAGDSVFEALCPALRQRRALWTARLPEAEQRALLTRDLTAQLGSEFFLAPITVRDREIGLIFADRNAGARPLDEESFDSFGHFCEQANLALAYLMK